MLGLVCLVSNYTQTMTFGNGDSNVDAAKSLTETISVLQIYCKIVGHRDVNT